MRWRSESSSWLRTGHGEQVHCAGGQQGGQRGQRGVTEGDRCRRWGERGSRGSRSHRVFQEEHWLLWQNMAAMSGLWTWSHFPFNISMLSWEQESKVKTGRSGRRWPHFCLIGFCECWKKVRWVPSLWQVSSSASVNAWVRQH